MKLGVFAIRWRPSQPRKHRRRGQVAMGAKAKLRRTERVDRPRGIEELCAQLVGQRRVGESLQGEMFADNVRKQRRHLVAC